jgi:transglutaminase-like putative cysteine protease
MSRLHKALFAVRPLAAALFAAGLGLPLLHYLGLQGAMPRYCLYAAGMTAVFYLISRKKAILLAATLLFFVSQAVLLFMGRGALFGLLQLARAAAGYFTAPGAQLLFYQEHLCLFLAAVFSALALALTQPDQGFYPPVFLAAAVMAGAWLGGTRGGVAAVLPVLAALLLLLAYTGPSAAALARPAPEKAALRAAPWAALLLAAAFLMTPASGMTVQPFGGAAERLRKFAEDYFFFKDARTVFSLAQQGYRPMGKDGLGGEARPERNAVMEVTADSKVYLRGAIFNEYSGRDWYDSLSSRRYNYTSIRFEALRDTLLDASLPLGATLAEKTAAVRMTGASASTLFVPQRLRSLSPGELSVYFNDSSELFTTRSLHPGDRYQVTYADTLSDSPGIKELAAAAGQLEDPRYADVWDIYGKLPSHMQKELYDMAAAVTAGAQSPYDKAEALSFYLRTTYTYSLNVPDPPDNADFAAYFLLTAREGYCTYFASAMTVLCRMAGLPARYVEGFVADPVDGVAYVTGMDAHAWTEVYFSGLGWVTFDATPGRGSKSLPPDSTPPPAAPSPSPSPSPSPAPSLGTQPSPTPPLTAAPATPPPGQATPAPDKAPDAPRRFPFILLVLLALALLWWRYRATDPLRLADREKNNGKALLHLFAQLSRLPSGGRAPGETAADFALRMENLYHIPLSGTANAVSLAAYSRSDIPRKAVDEAKLAYAALKNQLPLRSRFRAAAARMARLRKPGNI